MFGFFKIKVLSNFQDRIKDLADQARTLDSDIANRKDRLQVELDEVRSAQIALHSVVNTSVL